MASDADSVAILVCADQSTSNRTLPKKQKAKKQKAKKQKRKYKLSVNGAAVHAAKRRRNQGDARHFGLKKKRSE
jgi:hypothetical protein